MALWVLGRCGQVVDADTIARVTARNVCFAVLVRTATLIDDVRQRRDHGSGEEHRQIIFTESRSVGSDDNDIESLNGNGSCRTQQVAVYPGLHEDDALIVVDHVRGQCLPSAVGGAFPVDHEAGAMATAASWVRSPSSAGGGRAASVLVQGRAPQTAPPGSVPDESEERQAQRR